MYKTIVDDFTRHGFVTLRVDKPGCGDSEGGPARDVDFDTELDGYRQALKMLKARGDVDTDRVFIFGHSMGGVMAPLLAAEFPVRGIIVYGTIARTWTEYWLENLRRQMELADADPAAIDRDLRAEAALATYLYAEKKSPKEIIERYPHLRERLEQNITEDRYFFDRSLTFYRQLADKNLGAAWESFGGHALAIWGKADFVSNEDDHALIARIVNRDHPGHGTFLAMEGIDHGFNRAASRRELRRGQSRQPGEFNPAILEVAVPGPRRRLSAGASQLTRQRRPDRLDGEAGSVRPDSSCSAWRAAHAYLLENSGALARIGLLGRLADDERSIALERDPKAGPTSWPRPGPSSRAGPAGRCRRKASSVPARSGLWTRRPDIWSARATAAMSGCAGTTSWATSSTTSNGGSRRFRARKATIRASMPAIRPMPGSITRPRPATAQAGTCSATPRPRERPSGSTCPNSRPASRVKPAGEWNTFEITCRGKDMTLWVNGAVTNQWHDCEVKRGYVGLEAEGWRIEFRNVKVKPLDEHQPAPRPRAKVDGELSDLLHLSMIRTPPCHYHRETQP